MREVPATEAELFGRARTLAGRTLGHLADILEREVPSSLTRAKGWVGQLMEHALGASAGSRDEPDFPALGIELKTLPIDASGDPRESTFLCSLTPDELVRSPWATSRVRRKLARILWVPIEADPSIAIADRKIGSPLLWSPNEEEERTLFADWERFADLVAEGWLDAVTAHSGEALQIRPKAAHSRVRRRALDPDGAADFTLPRGFYLRARFTRHIVRRSYVVLLDRGTR